MSSPSPSIESESVTQGSGLTRRMLVGALATSAIGTVAAGGLLYFLLSRNVWWIAAASLPSLLAGGAYLGRELGEPEPLCGAILSALYFGIVAIILFVGVWIGKFPDPMPGLATGDSTFYFVWPLAILAAGVAGTIIGGRLFARPKHRP